ncbi:MAG: DUF2000 domain-containing protein [Muribaculaceae bacterium]|nr:DUF2000 domain-containing protein [Muribaculaceae bacterium]
MIKDIENTKCVLIVDSSLSVGEQANVAAVLAMTLGAKNSEIIGVDVYDGDDVRHPGITQLNIPVLAASKDILREIHSSACENDEVSLVDFTYTAQRSRTYVEYTLQIKKIAESELRYIGIGLIGNKKCINKYTGNLKSLR